MQPVTYH